MRPAAILTALLALEACGPQPRAASYFKSHPEEDGRALIDCAAGVRRGAECSNAKEAAEQIRSDQRLNLYKQGF